MNSYQHEFSVGFNFWMVFIILMVGVVILLGLMQHRWHTRYRTKQMFGDTLFVAVAVVAGIILAVLLVIESRDGITQALDNNIPGDEYAWQSVVMMMPVALAIGGAFAAVLYVIGRVVALMKLGWLHKEMGDRRGVQMNKHEAKQLTRRQGIRYKMAKPDYLRSVTAVQMIERRGNRVHRMRVICDEDWIQTSTGKQRPHTERHALLGERTYSHRDVHPRVRR